MNLSLSPPSASVSKSDMTGSNLLLEALIKRKDFPDDSLRVSLCGAEDQFVILRARRMIREGRIQLVGLAAVQELPDADVTAVIPARNEEATIGWVVRECFNYVAKVIVVEGRSTDHTRENALSAGATIVQDNGNGKGEALRMAVNYVDTPICVFVDADGSHDPIDIPILVAPIKSNLAEHVTGSRLLGGSDELHGGGDEFLRLAGSAFITYAINKRFKCRLSDSQNGFRAIRTDIFKKLRLKSKHTTIEMEMIMATLANGYRMTEVPTHERPRAAGFSKISLHNVNTWLSYGVQLTKGLMSSRKRIPHD